jgi:transposase
VVSIKNHEQEEPSAMKVSTVGLDLAKNVFQVHAVDEAGEVIVRKALRRRQVMPFFERLEPCLIGMEACGTSHHWGRELCALGHEVKLMPPAYVKAYVKRGKTDAGDAAAICEAVGRPSMRFVAIKSPEQQSLLAVHRGRDLLIRQRTQLVNMIRGQLAEFGIVLAKGIHHVVNLVARLLDGETLGLPALAAKVVMTLAEQLHDLQARIVDLEKDLVSRSREDPVVKCLQSIPGIGIITASALAASVTVCHRSASVHLGPAVCRLAGADAQSQLQRRQGALGAHLHGRLDSGHRLGPPGPPGDGGASRRFGRRRGAGRQWRRAGRRRADHRPGRAPPAATIEMPMTAQDNKATVLAFIGQVSNKAEHVPVV